MKFALLALLLVATAFVGEWVYRTFFRATDPLQPEVVALAEHFNRTGIQVKAYAVRHGFRHTAVTASASFQINKFPLTVSVDLCPSTEAAESFLRGMASSPNLMHSQRNGRLVMYLPMWGADTEAMALKVQNAFTLFQFEQPGT